MSTSVTSRPLPTDGPTAGGDELDDLFNYDVDDIDDPFSQNYVVPGSKEDAKEAAAKAKADADLGIDKKLEITRAPRAPRVKLDEDRLLSANGIPKLRGKAKHHLKFKGKGHEYSDASRLLSFYQLWLDDLFPKARFLDALAMVEKTGHKKRMQMMRMEWINEGKPHSSVHEDSLFDEPALPAREDGEREKTAPRVAPIFEKRASEGPRTPVANADAEADMDNDIYDATPRLRRQQPAEEPVSQTDSLFGGGTQSIFGPAKTVEDGPDGDELDALMADFDEEAIQRDLQPAAATARPVAAVTQEIDDDELEAMAEMNDMW
ncbi:Swi3-domain-containing protein [Stipitochalara longipes BDJ]|nr:Swi3-domain-containing protein [Stipitochalara longipes BDJ]